MTRRKGQPFTEQWETGCPCDQGDPRDDGGGAGVGSGGKGHGGCDQDLFPPLGRPPHPCIEGFGW